MTSTSAYSPSQITAYLQHIGLPLTYHPSATPPPPLDINYLHLLHAHQISTIPYENLSLHYSSTHAITIDPQALYTKFMAGRGRGGYCMENSIFYHHVLRALGFKVYMVGVKIRLRDLEKGVPSGAYIGYTHIVNIVTITSPSTSSSTLPKTQKYMLDPSFGGDGATLPVPLDPSPSPPPLTNLSPQQIRLKHAHIPSQTDLSLPKRWIYQYRNDPVNGDWNDFYAFAEEVEWFQEDFEVNNWFTSTSPRSFQRSTPLVVKFLRGRVAREEVRGMVEGVVGADAVENRGASGIGELKVTNGDVTADSESPAMVVTRAVSNCGEKIVGKLMLVNGTVKRNMGGKTEIVQVCRTEAERVEVLKSLFGIEFTEEEREGIRGMPTCLAWD